LKADRDKNRFNENLRFVNGVLFLKGRAKHTGGGLCISQQLSTAWWNPTCLPAVFVTRRPRIRER
jgi:hypothetical protein